MTSKRGAFMWQSEITFGAIQILKFMGDNRFFLHGDPSGKLPLIFLPEDIIRRGHHQKASPIADPRYCQELLDRGLIGSASGSEVNSGDRRFTLSDAGVTALTTISN